MSQCGDESLDNWRPVDRKLNSQNLDSFGTDIGILNSLLVDTWRACGLTDFPIFEVDATCCSIDIGRVHDDELVIPMDILDSPGARKRPLCLYIPVSYQFMIQKIGDPSIQVLVSSWHLVVGFDCVRTGG